MDVPELGPIDNPLDQNRMDRIEENLRLASNFVWRSVQPDGEARSFPKDARVMLLPAEDEERTIANYRIGYRAWRPTRRTYFQFVDKDGRRHNERFQQLSERTVRQMRRIAVEAMGVALTRIESSNRNGSK